MSGNFEEIRKDIIKQLINCEYRGDASDVGNEIGVVIGKLSKEEVSNFKFGLDHGISLSDGTHE